MRTAPFRQGLDLSENIKVCKYCCTNKQCALRAVLLEARKAVG